LLLLLLLLLFVVVAAAAIILPHYCSALVTCDARLRYTVRTTQPFWASLKRK
jgi:hypothetical protein